MYQIPSIVIGILIIIAGYHILTGKFKSFEKPVELPNKETPTEHYWQPYRQTKEPVISPEPKTNIEPAEQDHFVSPVSEEAINSNSKQSALESEITEQNK